MKIKTFLFLIFILSVRLSVAQEIQTFTIPFENSNGVFGEVYLKTQPSTVGYGYLTVSLSKVIIKGINNISSNELTEYGINFPFEGKNCVVKVSGRACIAFFGKPSTHCANFTSNERILTGGLGKAHIEIPFSDNIKNMHNEWLHTKKINAWEQLGYVETIRLNGDVLEGSISEVVKAFRLYEQNKNSKGTTKENDEPKDETGQSESPNQSTNTSAGVNSTSGTASYGNYTSTNGYSVDYTSKTQGSSAYDQYYNQFQAQQRQKLAEIKNLEYHNMRNVDAISRQFSMMISKNINYAAIEQASTPREVIANLNTIKNQIASQKRQIDQAYITALNMINGNTATTKDQATSNVVAAGVATGVAISEHVKANKERKEAEEKARRMMDKMLQELNSSYISAMNSALDQVVYAIDEGIEKQALQQYFYYKCVRNEMNKRFNYSSAEWSEPSEACGESSISQGSNRPSGKYSSDDYLKAAQRKNLLFIQYKYEPFQKASMELVDMSLSANSSNIAAIIFKADATTDPIISYVNYLRAKQLSGKNFQYESGLTKSQTQFDQAFYNAIDSNNTEFLARAIEASLYPTDQKENLSPLAYAAAHDKSKSFEALAKRENLKPTHLQELMLLATEKDAVTVVEFIHQKKNIDISAKNYKKYSPIELAFYSNAKNVFGYLLKHGETHTSIKLPKDNNAPQNNRMVELLIFSAIQNEQTELITQAEKYHNISDNQAFIAIKEGLTGKNNEAINVLARGIENKELKDENGKSLLHYAIEKDNLPFAQLLCDLKFRTDIRDNSGLLPANYILDLDPKNSIIASNLSKLSINFNVKNAQGIPLLHELLHERRNNLQLFLNIKNLDLNITGLYGFTALHYAARQGDVKSVELLLQAGADKTIKDKWGRTAADIAKERIGAQINGEAITNNDYRQINKMLK